MTPSEREHDTAYQAAEYAMLNVPNRVLIGPGMIDALGELTPLAGKRVLICTDPAIRKAGLLDTVRQVIRGAGGSDHVFSETEANVPLSSVEACLQAIRGQSPDLVIGLGGGSSLDLSKIVALQLRHPQPLSSFYGEGKVPGNGLPMIAIPTTAGTGSEVSPVAVVEDRDLELKVGIASRHLIPTHAICDPELTVSCPPEVTAHSGADALAHAIEAFIGTVPIDASWQRAATRVFIGKNPISDALALQAISHIGRGLASAVRDGHEQRARTQMVIGSTLAGLAFAHAGTGLAHALQYPLGAATQTPHGLGVGTLLPYVMRYQVPARETELIQIATALMGDPGGSSDATPEQAISAVMRLWRDVGIPDSCRDWGLPYEELPRIAAQASTNDRLVSNSPRPATASSLLGILEAAWHGDLELVP